MSLLGLLQPNFLVLLLPGIYIVVQCLRDNILQEDAFHKGNILYLRTKSRITMKTARISHGFQALLAVSPFGGDSHSPCVWLPVQISFFLLQPFRLLSALEPLSKPLPQFFPTYHLEQLVVLLVKLLVQQSIPQAAPVPVLID